MAEIIKNTLLKYTPYKFAEKNINPARIFKIGNKPVKDGNIIYHCKKEIRTKDNFVLTFVPGNYAPRHDDVRGNAGDRVPLLRRHSHLFQGCQINIFQQLLLPAARDNPQ